MSSPAAVPSLPAHERPGKDALSTDSKGSLFSGDVEAPGPFVITKESVFDNPVLAKHFTPPENYEGKHRFDPNATWTEEEEKALVRKIDLRIMVFACICFCALQLDRGNLGNALTDNFLKDLHMNTNDYNTGQTVFFVSFLFMEIPAQLISKKIGADRWIPMQMIFWSLVAILQCKLTGRASFLATRCLLGLAEGGFIPDMVLYLSYFYKGSELPVRLAYFWASTTFTSVVGSLMAAGILKLRGVHGWAGWQYLFVIEGSITLAVGLLAFIYLPPSPTQTASRFRGKAGWFTEREETILVTRILRDDPTKSDMHNRQPISLQGFWRSLTDWDLVPLYLLGLEAFIAGATVRAYWTLTLKSLKFSTFNSNLLTIPTSIVSMLTMIALTYVSKRTKERAITASIHAWWQIPIFIALLLIPDSTPRWSKYAVLAVLLVDPDAQPLIVGWCSVNSGSVRTRSISASIYNMMCQLGSLIASNIYRDDDKPYYHRGNKVLLALSIVNLFLFAFAKVWYIKRNAAKAKIWNAMSPEEKDTYLATTTDAGNKRLNFVFEH
ncbi:hypothetical protein PLICRDRAFT_51392 [Plicaturopsis crispa FD-325 SS-3]|nr:hypothetical protein PLICRDRAFT_51392 [Plicaturopsis crispa FD-325 SS-3]